MALSKEVQTAFKEGVRKNALSAFFDDAPQKEDIADTINRLHLELQEILVKGALKAFKMGSLLHEVKMQCPPVGENSFPQWMRENLTCSAAAANNYLRIYERFKENPDVLENLTIIDALNAAKEKTAKLTDTRTPDNQLTFQETDFKAIFERKAVSVPLKNYRVEVYGEELWGFRKDGRRFPLCDLKLAKPQGLPEVDWDEAITNLQVVFEHYFAKVEEYEESGVIPVPEVNRYRR